MHAKRHHHFLVVAATLLLALGIAALLQERNQEHQITAELQQERDRGSALDAAVKATESQRQRPRNASANLRSQLSYLPKADDTEETRRQARRDLARVTLDYGPFIHGLHLPTETQVRLAALLTERRVRQKDLRGAAAQQGLPASDPAIAAQLQEEQERTKAEITALIGAKDEARLEEYDRAAPIRSVTSNLANLTYDVPLNPEEDRLLTNLLGQSSPHYAEGGPADDFGAADPEPLLAQAKAFLSQDQVNALRLAYASAQADYEIGRRVTELQAQGILPAAINRSGP